MREITTTYRQLLSRLNRVLPRKAALLFSSLLLPLLTISPTQASPSTMDHILGDGSISGTITDSTGQPLEAVNVYIPQVERGTATNNHGFFRIENLPHGDYTLVISITGYRTVNRGIHLNKGESVEIKVSMKETIFQSETITVTGSAFAADPMTTPAEVSVLSGDEKVSTENASLGSSLEQMAGVTNISTGSQTGKPVIRGLSGNRIRVLSDGSPMEYQQYGVRHLPNVDPVLSKRIEVVRGASSVLYGSDALGGAINIIPPKPPLYSKSGKSVKGEAGTSFATNNLEWMGNLRLEGNYGSFGWTAGLVRRVAGNVTTPDATTFNDPGGTNTDPKFTGELDHTNFEQLNAHVGLGYQFKGAKLETRYTTWNSDQNFLLPNGVGAGQNLSNDVLQAKGLISAVNQWIFRPEFTYSRNLRQANEGGITYENLNEGDYSVDLLMETYNFRLEAEHHLTRNLNGQVGFELKNQEQSSRGPEELVPSATIQNLAFFVFEEFKYGPLKVSAGIRYDTRTQDAEFGGGNSSLVPRYGGPDMVYAENDYESLTGSFGITYKITDHLAVATNLNRGYRVPSIFEQYVDGNHGGIAAYQIGYPYLNEEFSFNADFSLRWRSEHAEAKVSGYRNDIRNYIYLGETDRRVNNFPVWEATQGDAMLYGADFSARIQATNWLQVRGSAEWVQGENLDTDEELPLLPATQGSWEIHVMQEELGSFETPYFFVGARHVAEKEAAGRFDPFWQFNNQPFGTASTEAYSLVRAGVGTQYTIYGQKVRFIVEANNLFNTVYRDFLDTYKGYTLGMGRNIIFKLNVPFTIVE